MEKGSSCGGALLAAANQFAPAGAAAEKILQGQVHGPVGHDAMEVNTQFEIPNGHQRLGINKSRFPVCQSLWHNKSRLAFFVKGFNKSVLKSKQYARLTSGGANAINHE
jgi:hypothetical protein